jgi:hypothetical protein
MADQLNAMMGMFGGQGGEGGPPDMSQLLAQMMGGAGGMGGMPADRLLGDMDDPAGIPSGPGGGGPQGFPDLASMMGSAGGLGRAGGFPGMPGMGAPTKKSWIVRIFPLVHALAMVLLVGFTIIWWEPKIGSRRYGLVERSWAERFGDFRGGKRFGDDFRISALTRGVEVVVSILLSTVIQSLIIAILLGIHDTGTDHSNHSIPATQGTPPTIHIDHADNQSPPPPHSLLQTFLPVIPPNLARPLVTASRYFSLLSQTLKDGFLIIFLLGLVVILADYLC